MIVEKIVDIAMKKADAAQATMQTQETSTVEFKNDRLRSTQSSQRTQINVKVIKDGNVGISSTTDPSDMDGVVTRALEVAAYGSPAHAEMPDKESLNTVKIFDPDLLTLDRSEMIQFGQQMMDLIKSYNPEIVTESEIDRTIQEVAYANSRSAVYSEEHTHLMLGTSGQWTRGNDILFITHGFGQKKRALDIEQIAAQVIKYFRMAEQIVPIAVGEMPVIFTPEGLSALLLTLRLALDGKNVYQGASPLGERLGHQVTDPRFTIVDNPFVPFGDRSSAFDDEGVRRRVTPLIENGILKSFLYDLDTAGRAGAKPTGHGSNRLLTNLIIEPGELALDEMVRNVESGLFVHNLLGLGQGNPINGEFSANILLGYKIEKGEVVGRVKDVMLAGNAYDSIRHITAISKEREWITGPYSMYSGLIPYIQVRGLSVTAK